MTVRQSVYYEGDGVRDEPDRLFCRKEETFLGEKKHQFLSVLVRDLELSRKKHPIHETGTSQL